MDAKKLIENFELIAEAPGGVERLRELILDLAIRGRLVAPDDTSPSGGELLQRMRLEREFLVRKRATKRRIAQPFDEDTQPFEIPPRWDWGRLCEVTRDWGQKVPNQRFSYIDVGSIDGKRGRLGSEQAVLEPSEAPSRARKLVRHGTVIYSTVRPYLLNVAIIDRDLDPEPIASTAFAVLHPLSGLCAQFLRYYLRSKIFTTFVESQMVGMAYPAINDAKLFQGLVPIPPLAEQQRIVDRIDELTTLCDKLEKKHKRRNRARKAVQRSTLETLTTADTPEALASAWLRVRDHWSTLTSYPDSVPGLRQTILELAVRGSLDTRSGNEEPAEILLQRVVKEKDDWARDKRQKVKSSRIPLKAADVPFALPSSWEWVRLEEVSFQITDGAHQTPTYIAHGVPFLSVKDISEGRLDFSNTRYISRQEHEELCRRCKPALGDVLLTKVGTTGIAVAIDTDAEFSIFVSVALIKQVSSCVLPRYLALVLNSPMVRAQSAAGTEGVGNKNLVLRKIRNFVVPIAPLHEQKRIVSRVGAFMTLCADLEERAGKQLSLAQKLVEAATDTL